MLSRMQRNRLEKTNDYQHALVRYAYLNTHIAIIVSLFCACITFFAFFSLHSSNGFLLVWFIAYLLVTLCRVVIVHLYESHPVPKEHTQFWYRLFLCCTLGVGIIWGLPAFLFMPQGTDIQQVLMLLIVIGATMVAVPILSPLPFAAAIFLIATFCPYIISLAMLQENIYFLVDAALVLYLIYFFYITYKCNKLIKNTIQIELQNRQLEQQLQQLKSKVSKKQNHFKNLIAYF